MGVSTLQFIYYSQNILHFKFNKLVDKNIAYFSMFVFGIKPI